MKLVASVLDADDGEARLQGGFGGSNFGSQTFADGGDDGRLITGANAGSGGPAIAAFTERRTEVDGSRSRNTYLPGQPFTPNIPGLQGGAEAFGLLDGVDQSDDYFDSLDAALAITRANAGGPLGDPLLAFLKKDRGPTGFDDDFAGFDFITLVNLTDAPLERVTFSAKPAGSTALLPPLRLTAGGFTRDEQFGGQGDEIIDLGIGELWSTLVPEGALSVQMGVGALTDAFEIGEFASVAARFIFAPAAPPPPPNMQPIPLPAPAWMLLSALGGLWLLRRRRA